MLFVKGTLPTFCFQVSPTVICIALLLSEPLNFLAAPLCFIAPLFGLCLSCGSGVSVHNLKFLMLIFAGMYTSEFYSSIFLLSFCQFVLQVERIDLFSVFCKLCLYYYCLCHVFYSQYSLRNNCARACVYCHTVLLHSICTCLLWNFSLCLIIKRALTTCTWNFTKLYS